jgi:hypothetical protein
MTSPSAADLGMRLYGMLQHLLAALAQGKLHPQAENPRDVVEKDDALDAVVQIAAALDELAQNGVIPLDRATWIASLLMVVRDYIQPLPPGLAADGVTDNLTPDLAEMVTALRQARAEPPK